MEALDRSTAEKKKSLTIRWTPFIARVKIALYFRLFEQLPSLSIIREGIFLSG